MSVIKRAGRPKKFDRDEALLRAIGVFWKQGYEGASMKHLTDSMRMNSPSIYAEFGDKHALYLAAINRYMNDDACGPLIALESEPDIVEAVRAFLEAAIDYSTQHESGAKGCFLASCVSTSAGYVEGTATLLKTAIENTDKRIAARFEVEKERGKLPANFPSKEKAKLLFDMRQGLVFRARAGFTENELLNDIENSVSAVFADTF